MSDIIVDTKKSVYKPITVTINGRKITVRKVTEEVMRKIEEYDDLIEKGSLSGNFDRLRYLMGDQPEIKLLSVAEAKDLIIQITINAHNPDKEKPKTRKELQVKKKIPHGAKKSRS